MCFCESVVRISNLQGSAAVYFGCTDTKLILGILPSMWRLTLVNRYLTAVHGGNNIVTPLGPYEKGVLFSCYNFGNPITHKRKLLCTQSFQYTWLPLCVKPTMYMLHFWYIQYEFVCVEAGKYTPCPIHAKWQLCIVGCLQVANFNYVRLEHQNHNRLGYNLGKWIQMQLTTFLTHSIWTVTIFFNMQ